MFKVIYCKANLAPEIKEVHDYSVSTARILLGHNFEVVKVDTNLIIYQAVDNIEGARLFRGRKYNLPMFLGTYKKPGLTQEELDYLVREILLPLEIN